MINDTLAIIQTVDFFTPIVNDPYDFGQIAVANALSDIYAMGGTPLTAMNIVCFPSKVLDISVLQDMLRGGIDKMRESGVVLIGGHSIDDKELKYGLSVTGSVHPKHMVTNSGAQVGDKLILTKPLGTGIINTALKAGIANEQIADKVTRYMALLNKKASQLMQEFKVHSCTDITGFGLVGHTLQLAINSKIGIKIQSNAVPIFPEAIDFATRGFCPGGLQRNRDYYSNMVDFPAHIPEYMNDLIFDPQTSGGLLIVLSSKEAQPLLGKLQKAGLNDSAIIGDIIEKPTGKIIVE
jgi:selenide,water dikinase